MIKKTLLIFIALVFSILSVNAQVELTSCQAVNWVNGETYLINLSNPIISSGTSCFTTASGTIENITLKQINDKITITSGVASNYYFLVSSVNNSKLLDWNFDIEANPITKPVRLINGVIFSHNYIDNLKFVGGNNFKFASTSSAIEVHTKNNVFNNSLFITYRPFELDYGSPNSLDRQVKNNQFINTYMQSDKSPFCGRAQAIVGNNSIENGAIDTNLDSGYCQSNGDFDVFNGYIERNNSDTDSNDDNIGDGDSSKRMLIEFSVHDKSYSFIQDTIEAYPFMTSSNTNYISMNPEEISFGVTGFYNLAGLDNIGVVPLQDYLNITSIKSLNLGSNSVMTNFDNDETPVVLLKGASTSGSSEKGFIQTKGNTDIFNIYFTLGKTGGFWNWLSNYDATSLIINNEIYNNYFEFQSEFNSSNGELIDVASRNLKIYNNTFEVGTFKHELFAIDDDDAKVYLNNFTSVNGQSYLCSSCFNVDFYNNYLDILISPAKVPNLFIDLNSTAEYQSGNTIYYFNIGNYWSGYSENCSDADNDGLCDSPFNELVFVYGGGNYTDHKVLAEYPFDFQSHLLTADSSITIANFTTTLISPTNNSNYELSSPSSTITFSFSHNSAFTDLTCSYYIDNILEYSLDNVVASTIQNISFAGWSNQSSQVYVECSNSYIASNSSTHYFNVSILGTTTTPPTNGEASEVSGGLDVNNVLDFNDIETSAENTGSLLNAFVNLILIIGVPVVIIIVIMGFFVIIGNVIG